MERFLSISSQFVLAGDTRLEGSSVSSFWEYDMDTYLEIQEFGLTRASIALGHNCQAFEMASARAIPSTPDLGHL
jgi:hypothetical protein